MTRSGAGGASRRGALESCVGQQQQSIKHDVMQSSFNSKMMDTMALPHVAALIKSHLAHRVRVNSHLAHGVISDGKLNVLNKCLGSDLFTLLIVR